MINWRTTLGGSLSALGKALFGVPMALAALAPSILADVPKWFIVTSVCGGLLLTCFGSFFASLFARDAKVSDEEAGAGVEPPLSDLGRKLSAVFIMAGLLFCVGCAGVQKSSSVADVEKEQTTYTEASWANEDAQFETQQRAHKIDRERLIQAEMNASLAQQQNLSKADPVKYPAADLIAETARLYALADLRRRKFADAQVEEKAIHDRNTATNRANARRAAAALRKTDPPPPVDLTKQVQSNTGTQPANATLIEPLPEPGK